MGDRFLKLPEVKYRTGLSRSTIYLYMAQKNFPAQICIGGRRAVGWLESEIEDWLQQQIKASRSGK